MYPIIVQLRLCHPADDDAVPVVAADLVVLQVAAPARVDPDGRDARLVLSLPRHRLQIRTARAESAPSTWKVEAATHLPTEHVPLHERIGALNDLEPRLLQAADYRSNQRIGALNDPLAGRQSGKHDITRPYVWRIRPET